MKSKKSRILAIVMNVVVLVSVFTLGTVADDLHREVTAMEEKDMYLSYNGEEFLARDVNENVVYPITINGTSYLPTRAVCSIAGLKVDWDDATRTILLTSSDYVPTDDTGYSIETEINDTKADANILPVDGGKFKGRVGETLETGVDQDDYYKFEVAEQGIVEILIESDPEADMDTSILNADGDNIQGIYSVPADGQELYRMPLSEGTYYLKVYYDYEETTYKIDTAFTATPDDGENDYYQDDAKVFTMDEDTLVVYGATGTWADLYQDYVVVEDYNSNDYDITLDWLGAAADSVRVTLYDAEEYVIEDLYFDEEADMEQTLSGTVDTEIDSIVISIVPSNYTTVCNEYTFTIKK